MKLYILGAITLAIATLVECKPMGEHDSSVVEVDPMVDTLVTTPDGKDTMNKAQVIAPIGLSSSADETSIAEGGIGYQSQKVRDMISEELMEEEKEFSASRNIIGACTERSKESCDAFVQTDGTRCSNDATGVHCKTRSGEICSDDAVELCYSFTDNNGLYCSNGSCNRLIEVK